MPLAGQRPAKPPIAYRGAEAEGVEAAQRLSHQGDRPMQVTQSFKAPRSSSHASELIVQVRETTSRDRHHIEIATAPADGPPNFIIVTAAERDALVALLKSVPMA